MSFMNPLLLLGALGIALPILAHLLNKHQYQITPWAAMQFLNKNVRVRSRQIRLRDILLLILRCLAVLLLALAISKPIMDDSDGVLAKLGDRRAGVIIAIDASYSMHYKAGSSTRFERAIKTAESIVSELHPGDPVCLVLLGAEHKVVARNMAFDRARFMAILQAQKAVPEALDLNSVPRHLKALADEMEAPQKEVYVITDAQATDWGETRERLREAFAELGASASTFLVPIEGDAENLAITSLDLISGVLRKGTVARYRVTVRNFGAMPAADVVVKGVVNKVTVDTKTIPAIAAGASETVSLFVPFHNAGAARISAELAADALLTDNIRRTVAVIRDRVSVLCVEESASTFGGYIAAALRPDEDAPEQDFTVQSVSWINLPSQDLSSFDVVALADVPAITPEQAGQLDAYVRAGNGLIWFPGDTVKPAVWNERSALAATPLLPAVIGRVVESKGATGAGQPLDSSLSDHIVCNPLRSLSEDLLSEARFTQQIQVQPSPTGTAVLSLAGGTPLLIEQPLGRGQVFMFTSSAEPAWNNMALTPMFPMLLQQMVTYLTAREFEKPRLVGHSLTLSYTQQPDASDAVFDTPSGESLSVPVREQRKRFVAMLEHADEAGFYEAKVGVQAPGMPIAVNVDTAESAVKSLSRAELIRRLDGTAVSVVSSEAELADAISQARSQLSLWRACVIAVLLLFVIESVLADQMQRKLQRGSA